MWLVPVIANIIIALTRAVPATPKSTFWEDLFKLVVGFVLTGVLGSWLAQKIQSRLWANQSRVRFLEAEYAAAVKVFDEISRPMDKLYYCTVRLWEAWKHKVPEEEFKIRLEKCQEARYEWNASLSRNLALAESYFSPCVRVQVEKDITEGGLPTHHGKNRGTLPPSGQRGSRQQDPQVGASDQLPSSGQRGSSHCL